MQPLQAALGARAFSVWRVILTVRNTLGETHYNAAHIANMARVTRAQYYRAIARLKSYKLVTRIGWAWHEVNDYILPNRMMLFSQAVRGTLIDDEVIAVPEDALALLIDDVCARPKHGGRRAGAGRPKASSPAQCFSNLNTDAACFSDLNKQVNRGEVTKEASFIEPLESLGKESSSRSFVSDIAYRDVSDVLVSTNQKLLSDARVGDSAAVSNQPQSSIPQEAIGRSLSDAQGTPRQPFPATLVPPMPYASVVPFVAYPAPLMPHNTFTPEQRVEMVARAYYGVIEHCYPDHDVRRVHNIAKSHHAPLLLAAAEALSNAMIYPSFWVMWSVAHWQKQHPDQVPSMRWVFLKERLDAKMLQYCKDTHPYWPTRCVYTAPHKELIQRSVSLHEALLFVEDISVVQALVSRWFPPGVYDDLVARAKRDNAELTDRLRDDQRGGKWLWS
jgi:hypothetical protein